MGSQLSGYAWLYKIGALAAFTAVILWVLQLVILVVYPIPDNTLGWFTLLYDNRILGLLILNILDIPVSALIIPMLVSLYFAFRTVNKAWLTTAVPLALVGVGVFVAERTILSSIVVSLSDQYFGAATDVQQSTFLAMGDVMNGAVKAMPATTGFLFVVVAVLIISVVISKSIIFSKVTGYVGILVSLLIFVYKITLFLVPTIAAALMGIVGLLWLLWYILVARGLYNLSKS